MESVNKLEVLILQWKAPFSFWSIEEVG